MNECKVCGKLIDNGLGLCRKCLPLTDAERNVIDGGEFHGPKWKAKIEQIIKKGV